MAETGEAVAIHCGAYNFAPDNLVADLEMPDMESERKRRRKDRQDAVEVGSGPVYDEISRLAKVLLWQGGGYYWESHC